MANLYRQTTNERHLDWRHDSAPHEFESAVNMQMSRRFCCKLNSAPSCCFLVVCTGGPAFGPLDTNVFDNERVLQNNMLPLPCIYILSQWLFCKIRHP